MINKFSTLIQHSLPKHALTHLMGKLTHIQTPWLKNWMITTFIRKYKINLDEALHTNLEHYQNFSSFFLRELKTSARAIDQDANGLTSPSDGTLTEFGTLLKDSLIQAKKIDYTLSELLTNQTPNSDDFCNGSYLTCYLAPENYHHVHMPLDGTLTHMIYVPGKLFSVNRDSLSSIRKLYCRNERVICCFKTAVGPMAIILVGACLVGSINTTWAGQISPPHKKATNTWNYTSTANPPQLKKGERFASFNFGSTVIVLLPPNKLNFASSLTPYQPIQMGQCLGHIR